MGVIQCVRLSKSLPCHHCIVWMSIPDTTAVRNELTNLWLLMTLNKLRRSRDPRCALEFLLDDSFWVILPLAQRPGRWMTAQLCGPIICSFTMLNLWGQNTFCVWFHSFACFTLLVDVLNVIEQVSNDPIHPFTTIIPKLFRDSSVFKMYLITHFFSHSSFSVSSSFSASSSSLQLVVWTLTWRKVSPQHRMSLLPTPGPLLTLLSLRPCLPRCPPASPTMPRQTSWACKVSVATTPMLFRPWPLQAPGLMPPRFQSCRASVSSSRRSSGRGSLERWEMRWKVTPVGRRVSVL